MTSLVINDTNIDAGSVYVSNGSGYDDESDVIVYDDVRRAGLENFRCQVFSQFVIHTLVFGTLGCLGLVGNVVSMVVLARDRQSRVASLLLLAIAVVDNVLLILWLIRFAATGALMHTKYYFKFKYGWQVTLLLVGPLLFTAQMAAIWLTVLIALTRYISVCHPYVAPRYVTVQRVRAAVIGVSVFSLAYNVPRFFERYVITEDINGTVIDSSFAYSEFSQTAVYSFVYVDVLYWIFSFFLPLVAMTCLNCRLIIAYRRILKKRAYLRGSASRDVTATPSSASATSSQVILTTEARADSRLVSQRQSNGASGCVARNSASASDENNITMVMIVVVLVFIACNGPAKFVHIAWRYQEQRCPSVAFYLMELSNAMEVLASSINFIIYFALRKRFRVVLHQWLGCAAVPAFGSRRVQQQDVLLQQEDRQHQQQRQQKLCINKGQQDDQSFLCTASQQITNL